MRNNSQMKISAGEKQIREVSGWWNTLRNDQKWGKDYEEMEIHVSRYLISRKETVLKYLDDLTLNNKSRILELGYGGGQTTLEIGKRGFFTYGIDISEKFCKTATDRCKSGYPDGYFDLRVGSIETTYSFPDEFFDAVIVVGALQYLFNPNDCFKEVRRVLKPNGFFIVAQRNKYSLSNFTSPRHFLRSCIHFLLKEPYELFPSIKSILTSSRLGYIFGRYRGSWFLNTKLALKGHANWQFDIKKRFFSYYSLKLSLRKNGFKVRRKGGAYYAFSENSNYYQFNLKFDHLLNSLVSKRVIPYLFTLGRSIVLVAQKSEE